MKLVLAGFTVLLTFGPALAQVPAGPVLTARVANGQTTFRIGERIPLELSYSSAVADRYQINRATYDRSGRMSYEQFVIAPRSGWKDPLANYFNGGFLGGGLTGFETLSLKPYVVRLNMNEWVRFDEPGDYTVSVKSSRITDTAQGQAPLGKSVELESNVVKLHIVAATPEWQRDTLQAAMTVLSAPSPANGVPSDERTRALATLRFLGSKDAIAALAVNLRDDRVDMEWQCAAGLMGLPDALRGDALRVLNEQIQAADFPVSDMLLHAYATLRSGGQGSPEDNLRESTRYYLEAWEMTLAALPRKEMKARAETAQMLSINQSPAISEEMKAQVTAALASSFAALPEEKQASRLQFDWDQLRGADMLPMLKTLAMLPQSDPASNRTPDYNRRTLKSAALWRWFELDPDGARQEIFRQIGSATPSLRAESLFFFPDKALPQFEGIWSQGFVETGSPVLAGLLARFGTGTATAQVARKLEGSGGPRACVMDAAALAYLVKFAPDEAERLLDSVCKTVDFQGVSRYASGPVLVRAALRVLDDPKPMAAATMLVYLADYGDAEAQKTIAEHFDRWADRWAGEGERLDKPTLESARTDQWELGLGQNLVRALIANEGWIPDEKTIAHVLERCVSEWVCQRAQQLAAESRPPYRVSLFRSPYNGDNHHIAQFECKSMELLEQKVAQFPKGTKFILDHGGIPPNSDATALESEARAIFERLGMTLEAASK